MKPHKLQSVAIACMFTLVSVPLFARPLEFSELSLLVRAHESESSIIDIASQRKLVHSLTPPQEATLRSQGASDSLIRSLHNSDLILSQSQAAAFEAARSASASPALAEERASFAQGEKIQILDVSVDRPMNLSSWGGPDAEFSVRAADIVESGRSEIELIEPALSHVHYATYRGVRVPGWEPIDPEYTSIASHTFTRPLHIDWRNPITVNDLPYLLYPVYSARGISLYFIGRTSDDTVRLAVVSR